MTGDENPITALISHNFITQGKIYYPSILDPDGMIQYFPSPHEIKRALCYITVYTKR